MKEIGQALIQLKKMVADDSVATSVPSSCCFAVHFFGGEPSSEEDRREKNWRSSRLSNAFFRGLVRAFQFRRKTEFVRSCHRRFSGQLLNSPHKN